MGRAIWRACRFVGLGLALALGFFSSHGQLELKEVNVCPEGPPKCFSSSIQVAVNAVAPGGLVRVAAGEYKENVVIQKSLTLRGPEPLYPGDEKWQYGEGAILMAKDPQMPTLAIEAHKVTIERLVVRGGRARPLGADQTSGVVQVQKGSRGAHIRQNRIEGEEIAVAVIYSEKILIEENIVMAPPRAWLPGDAFGIAAIEVGAYDVQIRRNTILAGNARFGIRAGGDRIEIVGNRISTPFPFIPGGGFLLVGITMVSGGLDWEAEEYILGEGKIVGNVLTGPGLNGITALGRNVQVVENQLLGFWLVGIEALGLEALTIQGNTVAVEGVSEAREEAKKVRFPLPLLFLDFGIDLGRGAGIFAFSGNGGVVRLGSNVVTGNAGFGILIGMTGGGRAQLEQNVVIRSESHGIALLQKPCVTEDDIKRERVPGGFSLIARRIREALTPPQPFPSPPDPPINLRFEGELSGEGNTILWAGQDDLCPSDFPWPPGFVKP